MAEQEGRVLITGGSGYLGGFVIDQLKDKHPLRIFDRAGPEHSMPEGTEVLIGDVTKEADVRQAVAGCSAVVHLIALVRGRQLRPSGTFFDVMVKGTHNVMLAAVEARVRRVVNISSISAMGYGHAHGTALAEGIEPAFREGDLFYALCKHLGEQIGKAYYQARGLSVIHLRPGVIDGDGANQGPKPPESPNAHWFNYVDPRDVAQAVEKALETPLPYGEFYVVAEHPESRYDISAAKRLLGYAPAHNWSDLKSPAK